VDEDERTAGFADYPIDVLPEDRNMQFGCKVLPASLNVHVNGRMLQGSNHSDDLGTVWLLVGADSGFEALTGIYLADIRVEFVPVPRYKDPSTETNRQ
jgi:hypothetical protein